MVARRAGVPFEWDGSGNARIKLINLDKADFTKPFEIVLEYPPELFGGDRTVGAWA